MLHRLVVYGLLVIAIICTAETQRTQREEKETVIVLSNGSYIPYQDEYEKMLYPTVRITTPSGTGSGVVIASWVVRQASGVQTQDAERKTQDVYILTAAHVVGNESKVTIELYPENIKIEGTVVITDTEKDLSLLCAFAVKIYSARLAPKDYKAYLFAPVWAVGCSLGLPPRPSYGHLCAFAVNNWEISAPVLPGNSGGPVYDARTFEVIGIAVWVKVYQYQLVTTMAGVVPIGEIHDFLSSKSEILKPKQIQNPKSKTFGHPPDPLRGETQESSPVRDQSHSGRLGF